MLARVRSTTQHFCASHWSTDYAYFHPRGIKKTNRTSWEVSRLRPSSHFRFSLVFCRFIRGRVGLLFVSVRAMRCSSAGPSVCVAFFFFSSVAFANPALFSSQTLRQLNVGSDNLLKLKDGQQPFLWKRSEVRTRNTETNGEGRTFR